MAINIIFLLITFTDIFFQNVDVPNNDQYLSKFEFVRLMMETYF